MRVKLKIKHIIMVAAFFLCLVIGVTHWLIPTLQITTAVKDADPFQEKENVMELLENGDLPEYKRNQLIEEYLISFGYDHHYDVTAGPSSRQGPTLPLNSNRIKFVQWYVDHHSDRDQDYYHAVNQLAYGYAKQGNFSEAQQLLSDTLATMDITDDGYWHLYKTKVELLAQVDIEQAIQMIDEALEYKHLVAEFTELKTHLLINQENYAQALDEIMQTESEHVSNHLAQLKWSLQDWQEGETLFKVRGTMTTSAGEPIPFAKIYLRLPENINHSILPDQEIHYAFTDKNGNFTIAGVPKGYYQLFMGIDIGQMDGYKWAVETDDWLKVNEDVTKDIVLQPLIDIHRPSNYQAITDDYVRFEWEPVKGAAYYRLGFGIDHDNGSTSSPMMQRFTKTNITLPVERLYAQGSGVMYDQNDDGELAVIPESLLAFSNPDGDYFWYVEAFDQDGNLLTGSNGFRLSKDLMSNIPYFQLQNRQLTNADRLLLEGNIDQALAEYKQVLEDDPNDIHALRMAERIIMYGDQENTSIEDARLQAKPYTERLAELMKEDNQSSSNYWFNLAMTAFEQGDWEDYFYYYERGTEVLEGAVSTYEKGKYAIALMKNEQLEKAENVFKELMEMDGSHRYMPAWTALRLNQTKDFEQAQRLAEEYPILGYHEGMGWAQLIKRMEKQVMENERSQQQFETGLELYMSGNQVKFENWVGESASGPIKMYFTELHDL